MVLEKEILPGAWLVMLNPISDNRGSFVKTFAAGLYKEMGLATEINEEYYSVSHKNVIRGMHFQVPPHDHAKLVYCPVGEVEDVLLDIRHGPNYGKYATVNLSSAKPALLWIPPGIAHGFKSKADHTIIVYKTSTEYQPSADRGIRWDSFGYDWGNENHIISDRDHMHPVLSEFVSPF